MDGKAPRCAAAVTPPKEQEISVIDFTGAFFEKAIVAIIALISSFGLGAYFASRGIVISLFWLMVAATLIVGCALTAAYNGNYLDAVAYLVVLAAFAVGMFKEFMHLVYLVGLIGVLFGGAGFAKDFLGMLGDRSLSQEIAAKIKDYNLECRGGMRPGCSAVDEAALVKSLEKCLESIQWKAGSAIIKYGALRIQIAGLNTGSPQISAVGDTVDHVTSVGQTQTPAAYTCKK